MSRVVSLLGFPKTGAVSLYGKNTGYFHSAIHWRRNSNVIPENKPLNMENIYYAIMHERNTANFDILNLIIKLNQIYSLAD